MATIAIDSTYYRERADLSADAKRYADWLGDQDVHMRKHMSVKNVTIRTLKKDGELLFWPEYEFVSPEAAKEYLPEIGTYVLKEWYASGNFIKRRMGLRLPCHREIDSRVNETTFGITRFKDYITSERQIRSFNRKLKKEEDGLTANNVAAEIKKIEKSRKQAAWNAWNGKA
jgi:hypothetical protein